jgi:hypothetical protein
MDSEALPICNLPIVTVHDLTLDGPPSRPHMVSFREHANSTKRQLAIERIHNRSPLSVSVTVPPHFRGVLDKHGGNEVILQEFRNQ